MTKFQDDVERVGQDEALKIYSAERTQEDEERRRKRQEESPFAWGRPATNKTRAMAAFTALIVYGIISGIGMIILHLVWDGALDGLLFGCAVVYVSMMAFIAFCENEAT